MDRDELIFQEYKLYSEQKENFIDRNFSTNKFYLATFIVIIFAIIYTNNVVFMNRISATLLFSIIGISICVLWWMNIDSYNTIGVISLIKIAKKNIAPIIDTIFCISENINIFLLLYS